MDQVSDYENGNRKRNRWKGRLRQGSVIITLSPPLFQQFGMEVDCAGRRLYTVTVKNITVSVDDETYRRARTKAAERDTSLSALVRRFLVELGSEETAERSLERQERDLRAQIRDFSAGDRLSREDVHRRRE